MNVDTGALYEGMQAIRAAEERGEPVVRVSEKAAAVIRAGHKAQSKRARKTAKQSRKRNRSR